MAAREKKNATSQQNNNNTNGKKLSTNNSGALASSESVPASSDTAPPLKSENNCSSNDTNNSSISTTVNLKASLHRNNNNKKFKIVKRTRSKLLHKSHRNPGSPTTANRANNKKLTKNKKVVVVKSRNNSNGTSTKKRTPKQLAKITALKTKKATTKKATSDHIMEAITRAILAFSDNDSTEKSVVVPVKIEEPPFTNGSDKSTPKIHPENDIISNNNNNNTNNNNNNNNNKVVRKRKPTAKIIALHEDPLLRNILQEDDDEDDDITDIEDCVRSDDKIKKRNINTINLDQDAQKVIDNLDLNVIRNSNKLLMNNGGPIHRRHSIEKFPVHDLNPDQQPPTIITTNSQKMKNCTKTNNRLIRPSKTATNYYRTRSDASIRTLRNGKRSKMVDLDFGDGLVDGNSRKRRRICSEYSGSEMSNSKMSGYDSDSSFSDLSSVHGGGSVADCGGGTAGNSTMEKLDKDSINKILLIVPEKSDTSNNCNGQKEVPATEQLLSIMKETFNGTSAEHLQHEVASDTNNSSAQNANNTNSEIFNCENSDSVSALANDTIAIKQEANREENTNCCTASDITGGGGGGSDDENLIVKQNILQALGLQSLKAAEEAKLKCGKVISEFSEDSSVINSVKNTENHLTGNAMDGNNCYTGTLKTVIKINRDSNRTRRRNHPIKITLQTKNNKRQLIDSISTGGRLEDKYKAAKEGNPASGTHWKSHHHYGSGQSSDTAGAHRKSHYSNRFNFLDGSSEHTSDGELGHHPHHSSDLPVPTNKVLVIPEKASSFSIHPGRLCKDECSYCFGKFGLFDTPCHIAQMKSVERQNKILTTEKHLTRDSCLCDACYRHVDRKANAPAYLNKMTCKRTAPTTTTTTTTIMCPSKSDVCHVFGCTNTASNVLRRKWIIKMRKCITEMMKIDLTNPGLHSVPICDAHFSALQLLMVCAMCKRRLAKNHVHYLAEMEVEDLQKALHEHGLPIAFNEKPVVCKLCKCFASILLKHNEELHKSAQSFFQEYKKRLLHFNDIVPMDIAAAEEPITVPSKDKLLDLKESSSSNNSINKRNSQQKSLVNINNSKRAATCNDTKSHSQQDDEKLSTTSSTNSTNNSNSSTTPPLSIIKTERDDATKTNTSRPDTPSDYMVDYNTLIPSIAMDCDSDSEQNRCQNTDDRRLEKMAVRKLGANPSISVRQLFPFEEEMALQAHIDFPSIPPSQSCKDHRTTHNTNNDAVDDENDGDDDDDDDGCGQQMALPLTQRSTPDGWERCTTTIQYDPEIKQLWQELQQPYGNQSSFLRHLILLEKYFRSGDLILSPNASRPSINYSMSVQSRLRAFDNLPSLTISKKPKIDGSNRQRTAPPALISLKPRQPNKFPLTVTTATATPPPSALAKNSVSSGGAITPQLQKIKFPMPKDWRPTLIPIDPMKKPTDRRKAGLVQVISAGKPYHITFEDYKKMCNLKRVYELQQHLKKPPPAVKLTANGSTAAPSSSLLRAQLRRDNTNSQKLLSAATSLMKIGGSGSDKAAISIMKTTTPKIPSSITIIQRKGKPTTITAPSGVGIGRPYLRIAPKPKQIT